MKNLITGLALLSMLSLLSCTKTIYTHEQVIDRYKTKQDVTKTFGIPTEKRMEDNYEEWLYRYDKYDSFTEHSVKEYHNTQTTIVTDFNKYNRYLKFTFDLQGNVTRCDYTGVDFTVKGKDKGATIALVISGTALVVGIVLLATRSTVSNWYSF